ncbi:MAG: isocitrate/isopropylmalate family dehydrogenase, partial [Candidatus Firestonebacteria bacterium]
VAAGGNINPEGLSMFEPMGGSAPKYTGKNVINPIAAVMAGSLMLNDLGEEKAGKAVENAVMAALQSGKLKSMAAGRMGMGTREVGDLIAANVK